MFDPSSVVVGLEVGTSKICAVVADVTREGGFKILGLGQAESRGVRKGEIVNPADLPELIRHALDQAEKMADVEIRSVWLGVTGAHIAAIHNRGKHLIASDDRSITEDDVQDAIRVAKTLNLQPHSYPLHLIRQQFLVDDQPGIDNPVGLVGNSVEADVLVVHGNFNRLQTSTKAVKSVPIDVEDVAFTGLASQLAVLTPEHKEIGTLVIDLGGGATEFTVTYGGIVRHAGVLAVGGDHVSQDLAIGLKVPLPLAEKLKLEHGSAMADDSVRGTLITLPSDNGLPGKTVNLEHLRRIQNARLEETFEIIAEQLEDSRVYEFIHGGCVLCGGGAHTPHIARLAERVLQMPVQIGRIQCVTGIPDSLDQPEFAASIGLAKYGSFRVQRELGKSGRWNIKRALGELFGRPQA